MRYGWDNTSVRPACDGPVQQVRVRNTSAMTAWALLPAKKRGSLWVQGDPGTDVNTTNTNQLRNQGLDTASAIQGVGITFIDPTVP